MRDIEKKSLHEYDTNDLLDKVGGIEKAYQFIQKNPHPRLWRMLAEAALERLDLTVAEQAFVRCQDYQGIKLVKKIAKLDAEGMKNAEVDAYFQRYDEAEKMYLDMDRWDLAVDLRFKLCHYERVVQLVKWGGGGDDVILEKAWNALGNKFWFQRRWSKALYYYGNRWDDGDRAADCYDMSGDYHGLERYSNQLPENHESLMTIGKIFESVGLCEQAVSTFIRINEVKLAVDCCISLNRWNLAVELAKKHNYAEIGGLLSKYTDNLMGKGLKIEAIELFKKANKFIDASKILFKLAKDVADTRSNPKCAKKLYVLGGLLIEKYHDLMKENSAPSPLAGLLEQDQINSVDSAIIENAWRGAEAFHFYLLAQRQLYERRSSAALRTAMQLRYYEDVIDPVDAHSLLALIACANRAFNVCSKSFIKLESLESLSDDTSQQYENLAIDIFARHPPINRFSNMMDCTNCDSTIPDWSVVCPNCDSKFSVCIVSGKTLMEYQFWMCSVCKHRAYEEEIICYNNCPLCHSPV